MKTYSKEELTAQETYKLLSGSIVPRPIAWVSTQNEAGIVNLAPFSFFNVVSSNPPLISISFTANKDTLNNILATNEAVVHLVNEENIVEMNKTAAQLSADSSEANLFNVSLIPSEKVTVPSIKNTKVRFETRLYQHIPLENNGHLVLLEVEHFVFADEILDDHFHINIENLNPISRLAGNQYGKLGELFELERPK